MKIKSIHVNNFGKLHDVEMTFDSGINAICEDNGWGKSTLSAFIRAMLYGLEGDSKRDDLQCERKRFAPWQGGALGGSMTFEADGKAYVVSRIFHDKASDDEFELRDASTNLVSNDYSEKLGEELFNINSESFMKTVFIRQNDAKSAGTTGDINAKLGNISDGIDLNRYAEADAMLKDTLNGMSPSRKTGSINKLKARVSELKGDLLATNNIESSLNALDARIDDTNIKIDEKNQEEVHLNEIRSKVSKLEGKRINRLKYEELVAEVNRKGDNLSVLKGAYGDRLPSKEIVSEWKLTGEKIERDRALVDTNSFSNDEETLYDGLTKAFSSKVPTDVELTEILALADKLSAINEKLGRVKLSETDEAKLSRYNMIFTTPKKAVEDINDCSSKWSLRTKLLADYSNACIDLDEHKARAPKKNTGVIMASFVVAVICIIGALLSALLVKNSMVIPITICFVGIALVMFFLGFAKSKQFKTAASEYAIKLKDLNDNITKLDSDVSRLDSEVSSFLNTHGYEFDENTVLKSISGISFEAADYKTLYAKAAESNQIGSEDFNALTRRISTYLAEYNISVANSEYQASLIELRGRARQFLWLKDKREKYMRAYNEAERLTSELRASMREYGIEPGIDIIKRIEEISAHLEQTATAEKIFEDACKRKSAFEQDVDVVELMSEDDEETKISLDEIDEKAERLNNEREELRHSLLTDIRQRDTQVEQFELRMEKQAELSELEAVIAEKTREYKLVGLTQDFLLKAKESLTARYMEPLQNGFNKYYQVITDNEATKYHIDANTKVTIEAEGRQRDIQMLSSGYQDLTGVCMRLAMADAMYPDKKPMLILDDPFVNLDDDKLEGGRKLLNEVSKEYQVLYFTCSRSRI